MTTLLKKVSHQFRVHFDSTPVFVRSPGRVNLIGEHTDYNEGFVLPAAIDKRIVFGIAPNENHVARIYALDKDQTFTFDVNDNNFSKSSLGWPNYFLGVIQQLRQDGYKIGGFDCVFGGDLPIGSGMSSSAALEGGFIFGLNEIFDLDISPLSMIKMGQRAENEFVGVQCGIMDQFANIYGKKNHVFKLDCRSLDFKYYSFIEDDLRIVLCDTQIRRSLASSEYNIRRDQCSQGVSTLRQYDPTLTSLRDVSLKFLQTHQNEIDPIIYKRCEYVVEENARVEQACESLEFNNLHTFGRLMYESHNGLHTKYEVSSPELDLLVDVTKDMSGVYGARMMGAGFGGCTINLVESGFIRRYKKQVTRVYQDKFGKTPSFYVTKIADGTGDNQI